MNINANQFLFTGKYLIPLWNIPPTWAQSNIPSIINNSLFKKLEPELPSKIEAIKKLRLLSEPKKLVSAAKNERDILPASSLQMGFIQSLAVCRIARYYSKTEFRVFIELIEGEINKEGDSNFASVEQLQEIFSIPDTIANEIFGKIKNNLEKATLLEKNKILLKTLKNIAGKQLAKLNPLPLGSGFLVGGNYLITNSHMILDKVEARQYIAQFNYIEDNLGITQKAIDYELDPDALFVCEPKLDYIVVQLRSDIFVQQAGYIFNWIRLIEDDTNVIPNDNIFIIHHPKGKQKKVDINNNFLTENGLYKKVLQYKIDSDYGSSGSPIFNTKWELVALHHAAIKENNNTSVQQGVRVCRIVEDLKKKSFTEPKLRSFIEDFVITSEQLNYPPLPSALEFDGVNDCVLLKDFQQSPIDTFSLEALVCPYSNEVESTIVSKFYQSLYKDKDSGNDYIATLGYDSLRIYITKEGEIVFSRRMHILPTLPLEFPEEEPEKKKELIINVQNILNSIADENGIPYYGKEFNDSADSIAITNEALRKFQDSARKFQDTAANTTDDNKELKIDSATADALNSAITYLSLYYLKYKNDPDGVKITATEQPSRGKIVEGLQSILKILGFYKGQPTGIFDVKTRCAVIAFQEASDDPQTQKASKLKPDGVAGPLTQKALAETQSYDFKTDKTICFGKFNHIVISYDGRAEKVEDKIKIYIDGSTCTLSQKLSCQQRKSIGATRALNITDDTPIIIGAYSNKNLAIPSFPPEGNLRSLFRGAIAEVRLWKKSCDEQIEKNMHRRLSGNEKDLIGYWRFEEGEGDKAHNFVPNEEKKDNYSKITGAKWLRQSNFPSPPLPFGLTFEDEYSYVDCGKDTSLNIDNGITIEAWVKHIYGDGLILGRGGGVESGYSLSWVDGRIRVELHNTDRLSQEKAELIQREIDSNKIAKTIVDTQDPAPSDRIWHHIAFTWGDTSEKNDTSQELQEIEIYIDGRRQNCTVLEGQSKSIVIGGQYNTVGLFRKPLGATAQSLNIGGKNNGEDKGNFNRAIAEVRLWKVARTQTEIKANMYRRLNCNRTELEKSKNEGLVGYWRLDDNSKENRVINFASDILHHAKVDKATSYPCF